MGMIAGHPTAVTTFPIPMRGNEQVLDIIPVGQTGMFPIPMRGNECRSMYVTVWCCPSFQSP